MKRIILLAVFFTTAGLVNHASSQVSVNINIGAQPVWGPVGYNHVDYYYMPDIDVYYNVPQRQYVYLAGNRWIYSSGLPARCGNYDIYRAYKVVINEPRPYLRGDFYRNQYRNYRGWNGRQEIIRDSRDDRYRDARAHDRGRHRGWDKHH